MPSASDGADLAVGAFTRQGPWVVRPETMPWRDGIDELRRRTQAEVPKLVARTTLPGTRLAVEPLASASIAQVHVARLRTGEDVVVKVQRPDIASVVRADLRTMAWLAPVLVRFVPQLALVNLPAYIELFAETIVEELDFRLE